MAMFNSTDRECYDTTPVLWRKINQVLSERAEGAHPPTQADWKYQSLFKIAAILAECP